jgi:hypothetical protein
MGGPPVRRLGEEQLDTVNQPAGHLAGAAVRAGVMRAGAGSCGNQAVYAVDPGFTE